MNYYFFAVISDGYANQFLNIPEEQLSVFKENMPNIVELTEEKYVELSQYRKGRIKYLDNEFNYEYDNDQEDLVSASVKAKRDALLLESDWVILRALEQGTPAPEGWISYRQLLRDLPLQKDYPFVVVWPVKPT